MTIDSVDDAASYVRFDWDRLNALDDRTRIAVLGELARTAGTIAADARANEIDNLRKRFGNDAEVARHLGIERQSLQGIGDGPAVRIQDEVFARPLLLRRTAEIILERQLYSSYGSAQRDLMSALGILQRRGRHNPQLLVAAARRLKRAWNPQPGSDEELPPELRRTLRRGLAHCAELAD